MPPTRIPIDGLWRCLCPSIDAVVASRVFQARQVRIVPLKKIISRVQPFHSSARYRHQETSSHEPTSAGSTPQEGLLITHVVGDGWHEGRDNHHHTHRRMGIRRKQDTDNLDLIPLTHLHEHLRFLTTKDRCYHRIVELVEYLVTQRGEKPALIHYDSLIKANADAEYGCAEVVQDLLDEMKQQKIGGDSGLYHGALQVLAIHPHYILRDRILDEMKERWFGLSPEGWHSYVTGLIRDRQYEVAMDKLGTMHDEGIHVQPWLYDIFTFQLVEVDELDEAYKLLKYRFENGKRQEILPSVWYYLLDHFSSSFHYEGLKYIWLRRVVSSMIVPSDGMCVAVLNIAARESDPVLATSAIRILSSRQTILHPFHYEALLAAYIGARDLKTAFRILSIMAKAGHIPDSSTTRPLYLYLITDKALLQKAWYTLEDLQADSHTIPVAAVNVILEASHKVASITQAVERYKELHTICPSGPNTETFNVLLQGAQGSSRAEHSFSQSQSSKALCMFLASEMQALGIKPDNLTYDRLIMACLNAEDYEDAFRYLEEMVIVGKGKEGTDGGTGWWMRQGTAAALVRRCVVAGDERAWAVLKDMELRGWKSKKLMAWVDQKWAGELRVNGSADEKLKAWSNV